MNMEAFIEGVRAHPCLWNPLHHEYRETHVKDAAWQKVVDRYNNGSIANIQIAKIEWKKLRDNHRDALKRAKLGKNKLLPAQITTWKYAKAMQFLEPHMKYRITENIEMDPPTGMGAKSSEHDVSTTETPEASPDKRRRVDRASGESAAAARCRHDSDDALQSFFNCIFQSTREMPQWMQTQVKKKIFAVIIESEEYLSSQEQNSVAYENIPIETRIKSEVHTEEDSDNY